MPNIRDELPCRSEILNQGGYLACKNRSGFPLLSNLVQKRDKCHPE